MRFQEFGRTQQHRRVHVMAAGVHIAIFCGERFAGLLRNGQCIHIRPQHKGLARLFAADQRHHAGLAAKLRLIAHFCQALLYILHRIRDLKPRAGMAVQPSPPGLQLWLQGICLLHDHSFAHNDFLSSVVTVLRTSVSGRTVFFIS